MPPVLDEERLRGLVARHRAFWGRGKAERPLLVYGRGQPLAPHPSQEDFYITPERVEAELPGALARMEASYRRDGVVDQDLFRAAGPPTPPWIEALLGCPVKVYASSNTYWREKLPGGWEEARRITAATGRRWREVLLAALRATVERFGGRYPIIGPGMRGPVDTLAALLGDGEMCRCLVDHPAEVKEVLEVCTDIWLEAARRWMAELTPFANGHFNNYGLWAPGTTTTFNVDAANILSPNMYRELFLPYDRRIAETFDYPIIHTHSAAAQHIDSWLEIGNLTIQIVDDPVSRIPWQELLAKCRYIQERGHPLVLLLLEEHVDEALVELSPQGLQISSYTPW